MLAPLFFKSFMNYYYTLTEAFGAVAALKIDALAILAPLGGFGVGAGSPPVLKALWAARRPR